MSVAASSRLATVSTPWELAAETIAVKIRWFGLLVGYVLVNVAANTPDRRAILNAILSLGALYTVLDTCSACAAASFSAAIRWSSPSWKRCSSACSATTTTGLDSPFRYYYLLSLICCAIRQPSQVTYATCALHCLSYGLLYLALPPDAHNPTMLALTLVVLGWVTWASNALATAAQARWRLSRPAQHRPGTQQNRAGGTHRRADAAIAGSAGPLLHQEKMAAFGLLAAGIAHEVGNPLTSISSIVQILQRRDYDPYTLRQARPGQRPIAAHPHDAARTDRVQPARQHANARSSRWPTSSTKR